MLQSILYLVNLQFFDYLFQFFSPNLQVFVVLGTFSCWFLCCCTWKPSWWLGLICWLLGLIYWLLGLVWRLTRSRHLTTSWCSSIWRHSKARILGHWIGSFSWVSFILNICLGFRFKWVSARRLLSILQSLHDCSSLIDAVLLPVCPLTSPHIWEKIENLNKISSPLEV